MPKPPLWNTRDGRHRIVCCYCKRALQDRNDRASDFLTYDHVIAESDGGFKKVPACRVCNFLKDNLAPDDWFWFIKAHPRWWKEFTNPSQVRRIVREYRFAQAQAGQRPYRVMGAYLPYLGSGIQK